MTKKQWTFNLLCSFWLTLCWFNDWQIFSDTLQLAMIMTTIPLILLMILLNILCL